MSRQGTAFIVRHEGFVSNAYRDPAGIVTIGTGFTNRSATVSAHWRKTRGRSLRMGDKISREESDRLLGECLRKEYGPPVIDGLGKNAPQHARDAGRSVSFNCGPKSLTWSWAKLFKAGKRKEAGARLRVTAVTARGRKLAGLVRRRKEEAELLVNGNYGLKGSAARYGSQDDSDAGNFSAQLRQDQELLNKLGYDCGKPDGIWGPNTKAAVLALQRAHDLKDDGILGPATRAKIHRLANSKREAKGVGAGGGSAAGGGAANEAGGPDAALVDPVIADWLLWGGLAVLVVGFAYLAWFYRDEIMSWVRRL